MTHLLKNRDIWLNINKPANISSAKVVAIIKRITGAKKVGHAGTLDPFATGVLPIALNKKTKESQNLLNCDKEYFFQIKWGEFRDSDDIDGKITDKSNKRPNNHQISVIMTNFIGNIIQKPSKYSAIKINGKRAYDLARQNIEFDMPEREVLINKIILLNNNDNLASFYVSCSKGTYIRTISRNICELLGVCGYVCKLTRIRVGNFHLKSTISLDLLKYKHY
ncbi:tRNA pseudouridine(55) synthase TruB [Rickettsiales bacterium]|jgi:tRNA pseudouridine55 synthase|nr:tRNA pseudouridine(55) synthase TruB [Rickettsiales bacterium]